MGMVAVFVFYFTTFNLNPVCDFDGSYNCILEISYNCLLDQLRFREGTQPLASNTQLPECNFAWLVSKVFSF